MPSLSKRCRRWVRDIKTSYEYYGLSCEEAFDRIYQTGRWGQSKGWAFCSGDGSHNKRIIEPYVRSLQNFLKTRKNIRSMVDLGCGDFNVGQRFCNKFESYFAVDMSIKIINENKKRFADCGVDFQHLNILKDELPSADIAVIRQVLQHLSNNDIELFLQNISGKYNYLLVTETLCKSWRFKPNKDIVSGPNVRFHKRSSVVLTAPPFNMRAKEELKLCEVKNGREFITSILYCF